MGDGFKKLLLNDDLAPGPFRGDRTLGPEVGKEPDPLVLNCVRVRRDGPAIFNEGVFHSIVDNA